MRLAALAVQLDPDDAQATGLAQELAAPPASTSEASIPPLASGRPGVTASAVHATVDLSSTHPAIGQPVDLTARIVGAARSAKIDGAVFRIAGPGIAPGTQLEAGATGAGAFGATFTFLQPGRFDVTFSAKADGLPVRSARSLVVGDAAPSLPPPAAGTATVEPAATATPTAPPPGKWL